MQSRSVVSQSLSSTGISTGVIVDTPHPTQMAALSSISLPQFLQNMITFLLGVGSSGNNRSRCGQNPKNNERCNHYNGSDDDDNPYDFVITLFLAKNDTIFIGKLLSQQSDNIHNGPNSAATTSKEHSDGRASFTHIEAMCTESTEKPRQKESSHPGLCLGCRLSHVCLNSGRCCGLPIKSRIRCTTLSTEFRTRFNIITTT